jgi:uroporphyrinogen-III synthase
MSAERVKSMLVVRGTDGRNDWIEHYKAANTQVQTAEIYRSESIEPNDTVIEQLNALMSTNEHVVLVVGSISEFNGLNEWLSRDNSGRSALKIWMQTLPTVVPR